MAVLIGSARMDESGRAYGGKAGDQTGKEVSTQNWYKHSKGWVLLRAKSVDAAAKIAQCMKAACANSKIGYDQYQRNALYNLAEPYAFDVSKVTTACETDCSALVRVCCAFAGITVGDFTTINLASKLMSTGQFEKSTASKYTSSSDYLAVGDILVTPTKGHVVVVLTDGPKGTRASTPTAPPATTTDNPYTKPTTILRRGSEGAGVKWTQYELKQAGLNLGAHGTNKDGIDGDFGSDTLAAVKAFQRAHSLVVDGEVGPKTISALVADKPTASGTGGTVLITAAVSVHVRAEPRATAQSLGTAMHGATYPWRGIASVDGWVPVSYSGKDGWISGKYAEVRT